MNNQTEQRAESLSSILSRSLDLIFLVNQETGRFVYASEGLIRFTGYTLDELLEMRPRDLQPGLTVSAQIAHLGPLISGEQASVTFESTYRLKDGFLAPVEHRVQYLGSENPPLFLIAVRALSE